MAPETRYARTADGTHVAYQSFGQGPADLVVIRGLYSHLENDWTDPVLAGIYRRLGSVGRVTLLDRRGTGLSDPVDPAALPTLEARHDDIRAVLDAGHTERAVLVGLGAGGAICATFAAMHPDRTAGLILWSPTAVVAGQGDPRWGATDTQKEAYVHLLRSQWGTRALAEWTARRAAPSRSDDEAYLEWLVRDMRGAGSAGDAVIGELMAHETDVASVLGAIHVPTLVCWRKGSMAAAARHVANEIPNAHARELPGRDHLLVAGDWRTALREFEQFVDGLRPGARDTDRVLVTVLFADIVGSTQLAAKLGDAEWSELVERYHQMLRRIITEFRGREIDTAGDGFFAAFDGPARAINYARSVRDAAEEYPFSLRIGLHTGECERVGGALRGVAVHIGARIGAAAQPGEILVSRTIRDLVSGSGIQFEDAGARDLKGIAEPWLVYRVVSPE